VILKEIAENETLKSKIVGFNASMPDIGVLVELRGYAISKNLPVGFDTALNICPLDKACPLPAIGNLKYPGEDVEIYTQSRAVTTNLTEYTPHQLKIFMWRG
jgi:hypothetical protein